MAPMFFRLRLSSGMQIGGFLAAVLGIAACAQAPPSIPPTPTVGSSLVPYRSSTPSSTLPPYHPIKTKHPTPQPPTPTPLTYTIVKGDTMLGVALRYGVSLEDLQTANPEVDPRFLSVETILIIPLGESSPPSLATPTPLSVGMAGPTCYVTSDLGAWCFLLIQNNLDESLENVSARIYLVSDSGEVVGEEIAFTPLNLIPPEADFPAMAFFEPPLAQGFNPGAELTSALPASNVGERYLPATIKINQVEIDPSGRQATVEGIISTPKKSDPAGLIWLSVVAYGSNEEVVGVRKLEISGPVEAGVDLPYSLAVFSLGPPIQRVEAFVEARPEDGTELGTPTGN